MDIATIRNQYPQYGDLSDDQLASALHKKHYSDMPYSEFAAKVGLAAADPKQAGVAGGIKAAGEAIGGAIDKAGTAAYRGLASVIGAPTDIGNIFSSALPDGVYKRIYDYLNFGPTSDQVKDFFFKDLNIPERDAESNTGRIAQKGFEGLSAAVFSGGTGPLSATMGAGAGVGSETASQAFPNSRLAPVVGSLVGASLPYGASRFSPGVSRIIKDSLEGVPVNQIDDAIAAQTAGRSVGSPVTGPEAINSPELLTLQRLAERSTEGAPLRQIMARRPESQRAAISMIARETSPSVPPRAAKQGLADTARNVVRSAESARTAAASPYYQAAASEVMTPTVLDDVFQRIDDDLGRVGTESGIGKQLAAYKSKLLSALSDEGARVGPLDAIYKETRDAIGKTKLEPGALDKEVRGVLKPINSMLGNALSRGNENIAMGRAAYQQMTPPVAALKNSPVGDVIPKTGGMPTFKDQAGKLLGPENVRPYDVSRTFRALAKENPEAVPKWISAYIDNTMDTAMKRLASGNIENAGGKFYTAIAGTPNARANLQAAFEALPQGRLRWRAMENTLKAFEAQSRRLPAGSMTRENLAAQARVSGGASPRLVNWLSDVIQQMRYGRNVGKLAEIFARSDSVEELSRIANLKPGALDSAQTIGRFVAIETQTARRSPE